MKPPQDIRNDASQSHPRASHQISSRHGEPEEDVTGRTVLQRLAKELRATWTLQALAGPDLLARWDAWAQALLTEERTEWLPEAAFRLRTGASLRWCRTRFPAMAESGQARMSPTGKRRMWHVSARPPRPVTQDHESLEHHIAASYRRAG